MKPVNNFIDESVMKAHGEPIEYVPVFVNRNEGLVVHEITLDEWKDANSAFQAAKEKRHG